MVRPTCTLATGSATALASGIPRWLIREKPAGPCCIWRSRCASWVGGAFSTSAPPRRTGRSREASKPDRCSNGTMNRSTDTTRGALLVALAALLWSSSGLFIKVLPLGALQIACVRSIVAALTIAVVVRLRGGRPFPKPDPLSLACAASYAGVLILFVSATKLTTAANAIFLQFSAPIYLVFLEPRMTGRVLRARDLVAVGLCLAAMGLFFVGRLGLGSLMGNLMGVASGLCLALFSLTLKLQRDRRPDVDPISAILLGNLLVALLCAPVALPGFHPT